MNEFSGTTPFEILARYERLSQATVPDLHQQADATGLWRGIGYRVGTHVLASDIGEISELLAVPALTPVPGTKPWLLGVANVRGNLMPVVDFGRFLFGERTQPGERTRLLVVRQSGGSVALLVDEVLGQRTVDAGQYRDAVVEDDPRLAQFAEQRVGEADAQVTVLSVSRLVGAAEFRQAAA